MRLLPLSCTHPATPSWCDQRRCGLQHSVSAVLVSQLVGGQAKTQTQAGQPVPLLLFPLPFALCPCPLSRRSACSGWLFPVLT